MPHHPGDNLRSRILVVDDNPMNCDILSRLLGHKGYSVSVVNNGPQALDVVRQGGVDLVLLDIMMPGMNGIEVLRALRSSHTAIDLPVIMLTALNEAERMIEAFREGADDYITRPIDMAVTLMRIESQLRLRAQARAQLGELHKIGGGPRNRPHSSPYLCDGCKTSRRQADGVCVVCGELRPSDGWSRVADSRYTWLGRTLGGRYFLEQLIGEGSVGQVYRAMDLDLGREFAVKIVDFGEPPALFRDDLRARTLLEVEALVRLNNPHVVRIYQVLELSSEIYALVMDFVQGATLERVLQDEGRLRPAAALDITRQVALALHAAHAGGLLHRDIKPANIMLERMSAGDLFVRLLDFGIARMISRPISEQEFCGTPAYSPPEQIIGSEALDVRADIYALGGTLYHMLAGSAPYGSVDPDRRDRPGSSSVLMLLQHHLYSPLPSLPGGIGVPEEVRGTLDAVIQKMMAKALDERYADIGEVLLALDQLTPALQRAASSG